MDKIINTDILRDIVIIELEKYRKLLIELGRDGHEKIQELIQMLEDENIAEGTSDTP